MSWTQPGYQGEDTDIHMLIYFNNINTFTLHLLIHAIKALVKQKAKAHTDTEWQHTLKCVTEEVKYLDRIDGIRHNNVGTY